MTEVTYQLTEKNQKLSYNKELRKKTFARVGLK